MRAAAWRARRPLTRAAAWHARRPLARGAAWRSRHPLRAAAWRARRPVACSGQACAMPPCARGGLACATPLACGSLVCATPPCARWPGVCDAPLHTWRPGVRDAPLRCSDAGLGASWMCGDNLSPSGSTQSCCSAPLSLKVRADVPLGGGCWCALRLIATDVFSVLRCLCTVQVQMAWHLEGIAGTLLSSGLEAG